MKLNYHPETDSLYIDLSGRPGSESKDSDLFHEYHTLC